MNLEAFDWNAVVVGYWNPAILTPAGIARRLFGLPADMPVNVMVPIDGLAPSRVGHDQMTVTAAPERLVVSSDVAEYPPLQRAMAIAAKAITDLPETPFFASGFNVRFRIKEPPPDLLRRVSDPLDSHLSDAGFTIERQQLKRALAYGKGYLNLDLQQGKAGETRVDFNFHMQSSDSKELVAWLNTPIKDVQRKVQVLLRDVLGFTPDGDTV